MKEDSTKGKRGRSRGKEVAAGMDVGDRHSQLCAMDGQGDVVWERKVPTTRSGLQKGFGKAKGLRIVLEAGTQSRWIAQYLKEGGHRVKVVDPRKLRRIFGSDQKSDVRDARELCEEALWRWERTPEVKLRDKGMQENLAVLRTRNLLVECRTKLVNAVRSVLKQEGIRVSQGTTTAFSQKARAVVPEGLASALHPLLDEIESLSARIAFCDERIEELSQKDPAVRLLRSAYGVGPVTAAAFVWTIGDPSRFKRSRTVGAFLGLRPRRDQSGEREKQLAVTKAGDRFLRKLLVQCAHGILRGRGKESALRDFGLRIAERGGGRAKKRAVVAVARKLAVILHRMWVTGEAYRPYPKERAAQAA